MADKRPLDELSQEEIDELSDEELHARIEIEPDDYTKALEYHQEERSRQARTADESFRSTQVTDDFETWRQNPGRWDFEGVDTIPKERKKQRAENALQRAQDLGLVSEFREGSVSDFPEGTKGTERGVFSSGDDVIAVKDRLDEEQRQFTLAHEVGHAVDFGEWNTGAEAMQGLGLGELDPMLTSERMTGEVGGPVDDPDGPTEELVERSEDARGPISPTNREYRESPKELFADFFAQAVLQPRNTKAKTEESRAALAETLHDPIEELEPTKEFLEEQLPGNFLPEPE